MSSNKPVVQLTAEDQQEMHANVVRWLKDPDRFKLWAVVMGFLHAQVSNKIASKVQPGRSGPNATLRAQQNFAETAANLIEIVSKVELPKNVTPEEIMEMIRKAQEQAE